ncbi:MULTISPECIES: flavodoxin family protein [Streptomyces]|uniref:FMN reductase n=1 Tax=Streptomyces spororaveus TaxID=284039 RepID=A0ABQ3TAR3_9ACTN|nr:MULTISPECIES: flavodoxin family protein [Streptomyces]MCM9082074.1 flavodoxin family protein [Streptomyces spororaveus]MCX5303490.1 flavodoxin family protein [Streptomyces sp. NBC_00160]GHI77499.1 FMN reductase [Streptomyces spororaveus]
MSANTHTPVVSIAYHSGYGHTAVVAEAVRSGAVDAGATVHLIKVDEIDDAQWELLDASDAIVFGSPTYMGTASGAFHVFAEASSKRWFGDAWQDKVAAGFTNSASKSGDKLHTLQFFQILAAQHGMSWINLGLKPGWNSSTASENDLNRLGFFAGAAAQTNSDEGADAVHKADIATAEHLGRRVTEQTRIVIAGRAALAAAAV